MVLEPDHLRGMDLSLGIMIRIYDPGTVKTHLSAFQPGVTISVSIVWMGAGNEEPWIGPQLLIG